MICTTCIVVTCHGPSVMVIDDLMLTRPTRKIDEDRLAGICSELRTAALRDRVAE